jgi:hypothetical protein
MKISPTPTGTAVLVHQAASLKGKMLGIGTVFSTRSFLD